MFNNILELQDQIHYYGLDELQALIASIARPAAAISRTYQDDDTIPIGASKMGGCPDVPVGFEWPFWKTIPLTFLMQVRLSELAQLQPENTPNQLTLWNMDDIPAIRPNYIPDNPFPETGMLYFFHIDFNIVTDEHDVWGSVFDDPERSLVFYTDTENHGLVRQPYPAHDHVPLLNALPAHRMKLHRRMSLPWFHDLSDFQSSQFSEQQADAYYDMVYAHIPEPCHFFFGYPLEVQGDIEWTCVVDTQKIKPTEEVEGFMYPLYSEEQRAYINAETQKWQFLFQIDTDRELGVSWGDCGGLYTSIPKTSLAKRQFADCWVIMQCY